MGVAVRHPDTLRRGCVLRLCPACGIAAAHRGTRLCLGCYRAGVATLRDAAEPRQQVRALIARGWTRTDIAAEIGVTRQTVGLILAGVTRKVRRDTADALDALAAAAATDPRCHRCDDVDTALIASADPQAIADRLGTTPGALVRHLYRHGRPDVARLFNKPDRARVYARSRTT